MNASARGARRTCGAGAHFVSGGVHLPMRARFAAGKSGKRLRERSRPRSDAPATRRYAPRTPFGPFIKIYQSALVIYNFKTSTYNKSYII